jgi:hypothetical protein
MSSIKHPQLLKILSKKHITPVEYFCIDKECALIKCFLNRIGEFMFIYVSSKHRFSLENQKGYELEDMDDDGNNEKNDDYTDSSHTEMKEIDSEKDNNIYTELSKKYKKTVLNDINDEPIERKIRRQLTRLRLPFSKLSFDIAVQYNKVIGLSFDDEISLFKAKSYNDEYTREFLYLVNLDHLISHIDDVPVMIERMQNSFHTILFDASMSNLETISSEIDNFKHSIKSITTKRDSYHDAVKNYLSAYLDINKQLDDVLKSYKNKPQSDDILKHASFESETQKQYDKFYRSSKEIIEDGIKIVKKLYLNLLILEEVAFDNCVMVTRVRKNFAQLRDTYKL